MGDEMTLDSTGRVLCDWKGEETHPGKFPICYAWRYVTSDGLGWAVTAKLDYCPEHRL